MRATCVRRLAVAVVGLLASGGRAARAEGRGLGLADCLRLAGERAPGVLRARGAGALVRARRAGEARLLRDNPELALALGPRWADGGGRALEVEVGLSQRVEVGGRRGARVAMVDAEAAVADAEADEARRLAQREAGLAWVAVLAARERAALAGRMVELGEALRVAVERRVARSEATALELALAQVAEARARAQLGAQVVEERRALAQLGGLLGQAVRADEVDDDLGRIAAGAGADAGAAGGLDRAPVLRGLEAERRLGLAEGRSGSGWGLTLGLSFAREGDEARVALGTLALELPLFERGQQQRAVGRVRARSAATELLARRTALEVEQRETRAAATEATQALGQAEKVLAPAAAEAARLLQLTFEAGELRVSEVLVARRELLDAGRDGIELRVAAASAAVEALLSTAVQP